MRAAAATAATSATAATAATGFGEFLGGRAPAEFEGHADVFGDFLLEFFKLLAGGEEFTGDLVVEQGFAGGLELADFGGTELDSGVLFLMQLLAPLVDALVLEARAIVVEETLDAFLETEERGIAGDLGAQFTGFGNDGGIFGDDGHARWITR